MLTFFTLLTAAASVVSADPITFKQMEAGHHLLAKRQSNLVSGILCGVIGVGLFTPCVQACPAGSSPSANGNCVPVAPQNDPNNCGQTGRRCSFPASSVAVCQGSTCSFLCNQGFNQSPDRQSCLAVENVTGNVENCLSQGDKCPTVSNGGAVCRQNSGCGIVCFSGFNLVDGQCVPSSVPLQTTDNCASVGDRCTTPFANSFPTCVANSGGVFGCSASCFAGFSFNSDTLLCVIPGSVCGGAICGQNSSCQSTCVNNRKEG